MIGPPVVPPKMFRVMSWGGVGVPAKLNESAFSDLFVCCSKADPLKVFVPDLVVTVTAAPATLPCSALMLPVATFTVSIVSAGATYALWFGSQRFTFRAPSVRLLLASIVWPLVV